MNDNQAIVQRKSNPIYINHKSSTNQYVICTEIGQLVCIHQGQPYKSEKAGQKKKGQYYDLGKLLIRIVSYCHC